jgi:hypothetical protein
LTARDADTFAVRAAVDTEEFADEPARKITAKDICVFALP